MLKKIENNLQSEKSHSFGLNARSASMPTAANGFFVPVKKVAFTRSEISKRYRLRHPEKFNWQIIYQKRRKEYRKRYQNNKKHFADYQRAYIIKNKDLVVSKRKIYRASRKEEEKSYRKNYRLVNTDTIKKRAKEYYKNNIDKIKAYRKINHLEINKKYRDRYNNNINYKLSVTIRNRLSRFIKKEGSSIRDLGCTVPELKICLESKFLNGMTWENHSMTGWHIDHIIPLYHFDLSNREQFLQACHYTNLQPLWATDNLRKNKRLL